MIRTRLADVLRTALFAGAGVAVLAAGGCNSARQTLGMNKIVPDEFRVVARAPLVVPPDYALRPPAPGEPRPQELQPESQARLALLGQQQAVQRDDAETLLVAKAGVSRADPLIRYVVDDEYGSLTHKDQNFADRVMFWRKPKESAEAREAETNAQIAQAAPLDPESVKKLTGDGQIVIQRAPEKRGLKLPGL